MTPRRLHERDLGAHLVKRLGRQQFGCSSEWNSSSSAWAEDWMESNRSLEEHKEDESWGWTRVAKLCAAANSSRSALDQSCCTRDVKLALTSARYGVRHASFRCGSGLPLVSLACFSPDCEGQLCNTRIKWGMQTRVHQGRMQSDS